MGEMAEYMLNGDDCQGCGEYLGDGPGFPRWCASCDPAPGESRRAKAPPTAATKAWRRKQKKKMKADRIAKAQKVIELLGFVESRGLKNSFHRFKDGEPTINYSPGRHHWYCLGTSFRGTPGMLRSFVEGRHWRKMEQWQQKSAP